jgi:hypothetical protein
LLLVVPGRVWLGVVAKGAAVGVKFGMLGDCV